MKVRIYHEMDSPFREFDEARAVLRMAYEYETDETFETHDVFRWNNAVDGTEHNVRHKARSLSVGDVVGYNDGGVWKYLTVDSFGFSEIDESEILSALHRWKVQA